MFGATGDDLSIELLGYLEEEDPELVNRVFDRRRQRLVDGAEGALAGKSMEDRVALVVELLDAQGYLADFEKVSDDHYRIKLHSCAIWAVANRYRQACTAELGFIGDLLADATVQRVTHKTAGAFTCVYEISIRS